MRVRRTPCWSRSAPACERVEIVQGRAPAVRRAMVLREALDVMIQRVNSGRSEHAGLSHAAAEHLAPASRAADELDRSAQH